MSFGIPVGSKAWLLWDDADGAMSIECGRAGDIGGLGVVVMADAAPPPGTEVGLIIDMLKDGDWAVRLVGKGEVLRITGAPGWTPKLRRQNVSCKNTGLAPNAFVSCAGIRSVSIDKPHLAGTVAEEPTFDKG